MAASNPLPVAAPAPMESSAAVQPQPARSPEYQAYLRRQGRRYWQVVGSRLALLATFLALWEVLARTHVMNPMLTSYPSALWPTFLDLLREGQLIQHTWATTRTTLIGFALSMAIGVMAAAGLWWSDFAHKVLDPFMVVANALPKIALMPIFYLWLGSDYSVYGMAVAISVFVTLMVIFEGFRAIDPNKIKLAMTLGASRWQVLTMVVLPGSVPTLIAAVKMNIGLSLIGVIVGEFQSSNQGLGFLIINGSQVFKLNIVMTAIAVLMVLSGAMYLVISRIEARLARRYA